MGNWIALGAPQFNADGLNPHIFTTGPSVLQFIFFITTPTGEAILQSIDNFSIAISSARNDGTKGDIAFTFVHVDGSVNTTVVSLRLGIRGLQTFRFNERNVRQVRVSR